MALNGRSAACDGGKLTVNTSHCRCERCSDVKPGCRRHRTSYRPKRWRDYRISRAGQTYRLVLEAAAGSIVAARPKLRWSRSEDDQPLLEFRRGCRGAGWRPILAFVELIGGRSDDRVPADAIVLYKFARS